MANDTQAPVPIDGAAIAAGGRTWIVPPLTIGWMKRNGATLERLGTLATGTVPKAEDFAVVVEVILAALRRNYPAVTAEELEEVLDLGNLGAFVRAVMQASGFAQRAPGEGPGAGEG